MGLYITYQQARLPRHFLYVPAALAHTIMLPLRKGLSKRLRIEGDVPSKVPLIFATAIGCWGISEHAFDK